MNVSHFQFDKVLRILAKPRWMGLVSTQGLRWVVPSRILIGVLLLFPAEGGIQQLFFAGMFFRAIEILAGMSFVVGLGIRLMAYPAIAIFAVRVLANSANSFPWLRELVDGAIEPHGDWAFGAMYLGAAILLDDVLPVGSGRWSVDYWLSQKLKAVNDSRSGR